MTVPILRGHDSNLPPIGFLTMQPQGGFAVRFSGDAQITREDFFGIFGNCGARITKVDTLPNGVQLIREAEIIEFSLG